MSASTGILLLSLFVLNCYGFPYEYGSYGYHQNGYYQNNYPVRPNINPHKCRNCGPPQTYGGNYGYGKVPHHPIGHPNIPGGPGFGRFPGQSGSSSSASASSFGGGAGHSSSFAETKTGTINLGPLQATFTKTKAKANSHSIGK